MENRARWTKEMEKKEDINPIDVLRAMEPYEPPVSLTDLCWHHWCIHRIRAQLSLESIQHRLDYLSGRAGKGVGRMTKKKQQRAFIGCSADGAHLYGDSLNCFRCGCPQVWCADNIGVSDEFIGL